MKQIFDKYLVSKDGRLFSIQQGELKPLKLQTKKSGYKQICLYVDGAKKYFLVHRLVAMCYLEPKDGKSQVNHKNANKSDNRVENLEWCDSKENNAHSINLGLRTKRKMTDEKLEEVRMLTNRGFSSREIAKLICVSKTTVLRAQKELRVIEQSRVYQIED